MSDADIEGHLRRKFESSLEDRVRRTSELNHKRIIGGHYFAVASVQCMELYRDGYMLGSIMCAQALLEAILKFVANRNGLEFRRETEDLLGELESEKILNERAIAASRLAWRHRNDFHHLNPGISEMDFEAKAKECVEAICALEDEIFDASFVSGMLVPRNPLYWDIRADGKSLGSLASSMYNNSFKADMAKATRPEASDRPTLAQVS